MIASAIAISIEMNRAEYFGYLDTRYTYDNTFNFSSLDFSLCLQNIKFISGAIILSQDQGLLFFPSKTPLTTSTIFPSFAAAPFLLIFPPHRQVSSLFLSQNCPLELSVLMEPSMRHLAGGWPVKSMSTNVKQALKTAMMRFVSLARWVGSLCYVMTTISCASMVTVYVIAKKPQ